MSCKLKKQNLKYKYTNWINIILTVYILYIKFCAISKHRNKFTLFIKIIKNSRTKRKKKHSSIFLMNYMNQLPTLQIKSIYFLINSIFCIFGTVLFSRCQTSKKILKRGKKKKTPMKPKSNPYQCISEWN